MGDPFLRYLENQRWVNGVEKSRADAQLEYVDAPSLSAEGAEDEMLDVAIGHCETPPDQKCTRR